MLKKRDKVGKSLFLMPPHFTRIKVNSQFLQFEGLFERRENGFMALINEAVDRAAILIRQFIRLSRNAEANGGVNCFLSRADDTHRAL